VAEAGNPQEALNMLTSLPLATISTYQPYWVARAHALQMTGQRDAAVAAWEKAIGLTTHVPVRKYLLRMVAKG
jgi:RNA polymerase sigma-70 factor (ECF subfamily)